MPEADGVRWCVAFAAEIPDGDEWLGPRERAVYAQLRPGPRRRSWRLGRFAAKRLLGADVEVLAEDSGRPRAWRGGAALPGGVSISHREELGLAAAVEVGEVGCDVEHIEPRSGAFVDLFFTPAERELVEQSPEPAFAANLVWSAKESALKVLGIGLRRDTREVEVRVEGAALVVHEGGRALRGAWRRDGAWVLTFVREP